ncbi:MAG TPA: DUF1553 domain-containing protein, partial [Candidatus Saccharimonadales bacterium]|nr:DUF1553 domain-containing protein [Candidatus Saccharimonadales bacterium]
MDNPGFSQRICVLLLGGVVGLCPGGWAARAPVAKAEAEFFEKTIQPILAENCHKCHSHSADKIKGNLVVDSLAGLLKGGDTGPAVVPGNLEKSLLIQAVHYTNEDLQMPPKGKKLSSQQIADLEKWVKMGAPWPGSDPAKAIGRGKFTDDDRKWWAFQPVKEPKIPEVQDNGWCRTSIDRFIFQKLKTEGLQVSGEADKRALIRRVYFDLWGLPPSPQEVETFVNDDSPGAYEHLIERLLESPRYGERWARHWLDLVRYAESDGYRIDDYRPNAWHYRDYVIQAFNEDKPYNRFVQEQLAGDELEPSNPQMYIANSFLRLWIYEYNNRDARLQWNTILNDLTDVTGDLFLGLGMQCARCHDHKFDPILQKDYYRLQAFFAPLLPRQDIALATTQELREYNQQLAKWEEMTKEIRGQIAELQKPYAEKAAEGAIKKFPEDVQELIRKPKNELTPFEQQIAALGNRQVTLEIERLDARIKGADKEKLAALRKELAKFDSFKPKPLERALTVTDVGPTAPALFIPKKPKEPIEPGYLSVLDERPAKVPRPKSAPDSTGRRSELARWLTQPENPLTTRVIVNRVWQYHFGRGLAATSSDFGLLGEKPSHPELLDWLAVNFTKEGWSFKRMHRLILLSATYRQSALTQPSETARLKDPENRLLWRMNIRRLDAEQVRDAMLAVSGELDPSAGGPAVDTSKPRRTIYTKVMRNTREPLLDAFDAPEGFASTSLRNVTTTPTQALLMFNSQYTLARAKALAARLQESGASSEAELVERAYAMALERTPTPDEKLAALKFLGEQRKRVAPLRASTISYVSEKMPYREDKAALMSPTGPMERFEVPDSPAMPQGDFTLEAFVMLKSLYEDGQVRTIASHWDGNNNHPGWALGVTRKKSASKPQTLALQLCGQSGKSGANYEAIFSGLHIELNRPYFVAVSVKLSDTNESGVVFYAKDLSNDDEPMQSVRMAHSITTPLAGHSEFVMGGRDGQNAHLWDGLIDDVRLSNGALRQEQLLLTSEGVTDKTVGYWQFESAANYHKDSSGHGLNIKIKTAAPKKQDPKAAA